MPMRSVSVAMSGAELGERFMGSLDGLPFYVRDAGRLLWAKIRLLASTRHVVRAPDHRLHPAQPRVARGTDLLLAEPGRRAAEGDVRLAALVQGQRPVAHACPHDLALVRDVHEEVVHVA